MRMRFACWVTRLGTHSEYVLLLHCNTDYANAAHFYVYTYFDCLMPSLLPLFLILMAMIDFD